MNHNKTKCLVSAFVLLFCSLFCGFSEDKSINRFKSIAEETAIEAIEEFSDSGSEDVTWSKKTQIIDYIELYSPKVAINGYIFKLKTDEVETGYIQIGIEGEEAFVVNLGFDGSNMLYERIDYYNHTIRNGTITTSFSCGKEIDLRLIGSGIKPIYNGGISYYLLENDGKVLDLESGKIVTGGLDTLISEYNVYLGTVQCFLEERCAERQETITRANVNVTNYLSSLSYMQPMNYYSGYHNHCTPTAATNLVMYWKYGRGFFSENSGEIKKVFKWFHTNMHTTDSGGTWMSDIVPPLYNYFNDHSGWSTLVVDRILLVTFNKIKAKINANCPVQLEIKTSSYNSNFSKHSVNVWGYQTLSTGNFIRITDNQSNMNITLLNYSLNTYRQFEYVNVS